MSNVINLPGRMIRLVPLANAVTDYLEHASHRGLRPNSLRAYASDLKSAIAFFDDERASVVALISERMIDRWLAQMSRNGLSPRSQARKLAALNAFLRFCKREHWIDHNPSQDLKVRFRPRRVVAPEMAELLRMIDAIPAGADATALDIRDRAILRLVLDTGIRIGEVVSIDVPGEPMPQHTVDLKRLEVHVLGKGGDLGTVPFNEATGRALRRWLEARAPLALPTERALFTSHQRRRITRQALHEMIRRRGAAVGLIKMHMHLLRHRRIGDITERLGLKIAQGIARHADPATTAAVYGAHAMNVVHRTVRDSADLDQLRKA